MSGNSVKRGSWRTLAASGMLVVLAGCTAAPGSGCSPEAAPPSTTTPGSTTTEAPGSTTTTEPGSSSTTTPPSTTVPGSTTTTTLPDGGGDGEVVVVAVVDISVGDCVTPVGQDLLVGSVELLDCDDPHQAEVYDRFDIADDELPDDPTTPGYPGGAELTWYAQDRCQARFADAIGESYWDSPHDVRVITPSFSTWDLGDRTNTCLVVGANGTDLVGSVLP